LPFGFADLTAGPEGRFRARSKIREKIRWTMAHSGGLYAGESWRKKKSRMGKKQLTPLQYGERF